MKEKKTRAPRRPRPSATTQRIIDHMLSLADPKRRDGDPEVETTMLLLMRVQRRSIREVVVDKR